MCDFSANCKNENTHVVEHKAVGKRAKFDRGACLSCASKIGRRSPNGPVIDLPGQENSFYRIAAL